jgi:hypothetical protein
MTQVDFMKCGALHLASKSLVADLALLSAQLRRSAGLLKLVRRVLKDVSSLCLSYRDPEGPRAGRRSPSPPPDYCDPEAAATWDRMPSTAWADPEDSDTGSQYVFSPRRERGI